ncbi:MAG: nucleotidyl transferase AbiEii/AbiGii toxin family protein [Aequorivita sp.]|nr:nucleotidyl transferase AbiEii/AbiGii toxin family protein [Aequorivita sp.]
MINEWNTAIENFIVLAAKHKVKMLMVGGVAVNFHGYQRHSADVDFWIDTSEENFKKLVAVFQEMDYEIDDFPETVKNKQQNISVKFSPVDFDLELITNFSVNKSFDEAYKQSEKVTLQKNNKTLVWNVISLEDLITSKIKSGRPKDLLDIQQLQKKKPQ